MIYNQIVTWTAFAILAMFLFYLTFHMVLTYIVLITYSSEQFETCRLVELFICFSVL